MIALTPRANYICPMENQKTSLERAFELAQSGKYLKVADIKSQLAKERLATEQISGSSLLRQLRQIIKEAAVPK